MPYEDELCALRAKGLDFKDCVAAFAVSAQESPFVAKAFEVQIKGKAEVDQHAPIMIEPSGAWVLSWMWISNKEAGVISRSELIENIRIGAKAMVLNNKDVAGSVIERNKSRTRQAYLEWLETLSAEKLDLLNTEDVQTGDVAALRPTEWTYDEQLFVFFPSQALLTLNSMALVGGSSLQHHLDAQTFILEREQQINTLLSSAEIVNASNNRNAKP